MAPGIEATTRHQNSLRSEVSRKRRSPIDPAALLPLAHHPNNKLVAAAFAALSHLTDQRIRALALDILEVSAHSGFAKGWALGLLIGNYRPEDAVRVAGWLFDIQRSR